MFLLFPVTCIKTRPFCTLSQHTHTNKHNHNPPWHLPVSDLSHPVAWTVSVTMSCALWQFSPSGWSTGPYGAIQGHRAASDEKHISWISNTKFMCPCRSQNLCKMTDYKWRQTAMCDHVTQIFLYPSIMGAIVNLKVMFEVKNSSEINKVNKCRTYFPTWLPASWKMPEVPTARSARKKGRIQKTSTLLPNTLLQGLWASVGPSWNTFRLRVYSAQLYLPPCLNIPHSFALHCIIFKWHFPGSVHCTAWMPFQWSTSNNKAISTSLRSD